MITRLISQRFAKIQTSEVMSKSYDQLVDLVATRYSNPHFKHPNAATLYEIQHHHKIISPGDCVLDLGAGPHFRWTDLALTLAENQTSTHRVVSSDKITSSFSRPNHHFVKGNFMEEQIRTKIALALGDQQFNTILSDMSPEFTEDLEEDAESLSKSLVEILLFSDVFLKKGGNIILKVLKSGAIDFFEEQSKLFFHQTFAFKPSVIRSRSPVYFLVLKGYGINHQLQEIQQFLRKYRGSSKQKTAIVQEYQIQSEWNPIEVVNKKAKNDYVQLRSQGRSERDIQMMFRDDPFVKIGQIAKQVRQLERAQEGGDSLAIRKAMNKFTDGKMYKQDAKVPTSREQWIDFLQQMQQKMKKQKPQKVKQNFQPLGDNEIYMKSNQKQQQEQEQLIYIKEDVTAEYSFHYEDAYIERELGKLNKVLQKPISDLDKPIDLKEVFGWRATPQEAAEETETIIESLKAMTDEEYYDIEKKDGFDKEREENVGKSVRGATSKFKNR